MLGVILQDDFGGAVGIAVAGDFHIISAQRQAGNHSLIGADLVLGGQLHPLGVESLDRNGQAVSAGGGTVVERDSNIFIVPCQNELDIPALYLVHPLGQIKAQGQCNGAGGLLCLNRVLLAAGRGNGGQPSGTGGTYQSQTQQARGQSSKLVQIVHPFQSFVHCAVKPPVPNPDGLGPTAFTMPHYTGSAHQFQ